MLDEIITRVQPHVLKRELLKEAEVVAVDLSQTSVGEPPSIVGIDVFEDAVMSLDALTLESSGSMLEVRKMIHVRADNVHIRSDRLAAMMVNKSSVILARNADELDALLGRKHSLLRKNVQASEETEAPAHARNLALQLLPSDILELVNHIRHVFDDAVRNVAVALVELELVLLIPLVLCPAHSDSHVKEALEDSVDESRLMVFVASQNVAQ
mmetsp:Transcript_19314/g.62834  ORF Transcript_19314/g.62834 Transcript_19314/m.62834 type:complete len:212 (-) Transcript_19314:2003-2638(-)